MAKPPASGNNTASEQLQTWILRVYIHCEGCKKKVFKVLQSINGVYKTVIDAKEHKATVTGSVNGEILVQKLLKSGKHAEILPESFAADDASGNSKKKKKQSNKQNDVVTTADNAEQANDEKNESKGATTDGNVQELIADSAVADGDGDGDGDGNGNGNENGGGGGGGKKKKNKKKKGEKNGINGATAEKGDTGTLPTGKPPASTGITAENTTASMEQLNLGPQTVYSTTPYDLPPYHNYYPTPAAYGVSYSTSYPSVESSYHTPPVYGYAQSHPSAFYPVPPPSSNYRGSAFDDHDDEGGEGRVCTIM